MDKSGRFVMPKVVRNATRIRLPARLLVIARDRGKIELVCSRHIDEDCQAIGRGKFAG